MIITQAEKRARKELKAEVYGELMVQKLSNTICAQKTQEETDLINVYGCMTMLAEKVLEAEKQETEDACLYAGRKKILVMTGIEHEEKIFLNVK